MSLAFYFDVQVNKTIADGLQARGIDVLRAQDDGQDETPDPLLLDRATELNRVLVTFDTDFLAEARRRQFASIDFPGIVFSRQTQVEPGQWIEHLELMAVCINPEDALNQVFYLPLR